MGRNKKYNTEEERKEAIRITRRKYYLKNRETYLANAHEYYLKHKEAKCARMMEIYNSKKKSQNKEVLKNE